MHTFKSTPEYEHLFQQYLSASPPDGEKGKYFELTIKNRLRNFKRFWGKRCHVKGMKETPFYQELICDIERYAYRLHAVERVLLPTRTPLYVSLQS